MFDLDPSVIVRAMPALWSGLKFTLLLTFVAMSVGIVTGTLLAIMRLSHNRVLRLRDRHAQHPAGSGDFLVLLSDALVAANGLRH